MPGKDPSNYSLVTYLWVMLLSVWGGITHNIRKLRAGVIKRFSVSELIGDLFISAFIGVLTFYLCEWAGLDKLISAVFIAITAHMGTKGISIFEDAVGKRVDSIINPGGEKDD